MTSVVPHNNVSDVDPRIMRTRDLVISATFELLVEQGFERATIEAIAERSGVARSTIYRNWPNRAELFISAFEIMCSFTNNPDLGSLEDELRALGAELVSGLNDQNWGQVLPSLIGSAAHDEDLKSAQQEFSRQRRELVSKVFQRAICRGEIDETFDTAQLAELFASGFFFRHLMGFEPLDDDFVETQVTFVLSLTDCPTTKI